MRARIGGFMRSLVVVVASLAIFVTTAEARPRHHDTAPKKSKRIAAKKKLTKHVPIHGPIHGQSAGAPWDGELHDPAQLPEGDGYVIRRPYRAFGTRSTVDFVQRAMTDMREQFPETHVLAVGDLSAKDGGKITEHHSHQSGRDVDIGLVYKTKPDNFPHDFVAATDDNLDCEATYALVNEFAETAKEDGGAQVIFLDFNVQGLLFRWAKEHGEDPDVLERLFQFPHRGASGALVRHEPNHNNHLHVRFRCPKGDTSCTN